MKMSTYTASVIVEADVVLYWHLPEECPQRRPDAVIVLKQGDWLRQAFAFQKVLVLPHAS
jgi:broad-specificity NMP kinase